MTRGELAALLVGTTALVACGGGNGGEGGAGSTQVAFSIAPTDCTFDSITVNQAGLQLFIALDRAMPGACSSVGNTCMTYGSATVLQLWVIKYDPGGGSAPALVPGTYDTTPESSGRGTLVVIGAHTTDAYCNEHGTLSNPPNPSGSITISDISSAAVAGTYDVTIFGTHYTGNIDATVCSGNVGSDVCTLGYGPCTGSKQCI